MAERRAPQEGAPGPPGDAPAAGARLEGGDGPEAPGAGQGLGAAGSTEPAAPAASGGASGSATPAASAAATPAASADAAAVAAPPASADAVWLAHRETRTALGKPGGGKRGYFLRFHLVAASGAQLLAATGEDQGAPARRPLARPSVQAFSRGGGRVRRAQRSDDSHVSVVDSWVMAPSSPVHALRPPTARRPASRGRALHVPRRARLPGPPGGRVPQPPRADRLAGRRRARQPGWRAGRCAGRAAAGVAAVGRAGRARAARGAAARHAARHAAVRRLQVPARGRAAACLPFSRRAAGPAAPARGRERADRGAAAGRRRGAPRRAGRRSWRRRARRASSAGGWRTRPAARCWRPSARSARRATGTTRIARRPRSRPRARSPPATWPPSAPGWSRRGGPRACSRPRRARLPGRRARARPGPARLLPLCHMQTACEADVPREASCERLRGRVPRRCWCGPRGRTAARRPPQVCRRGPAPCARPRVARLIPRGCRPARAH